MTSPYYDTGGATLWVGDCRAVLAELEPESVQMCVTSPPYWNLRDYGTGAWQGGEAECDHKRTDVLRRSYRPGLSEQGLSSWTNREVTTKAAFTMCRCGAVRTDHQIGLESSPSEYVAHIVEVFEAVRRVLKRDGVVFLNLGDCYSDKQLAGIPWRVAFALQDAGFWLRSDIIWAKPNPMPESVTDRPTKAHEYIFLMAKSQRYYYDAKAILEPFANGDSWIGRAPTKKLKENTSRNDGGSMPISADPNGRNKRSVWTITTKAYKGAHFACFPPDLIEPCILAGAPEGGTVLDPFAGSGTTLMVARQHNRRAIGIELNPDYIPLILERCGVSARPVVPQSAISA